MNKVAVLLSTYNGAKFLDVQMASLLAQEGVEITIYARDDGSLDSTPQMLERLLQISIQILESC
jgi:glycosyltransferase involved in cell wall biosynthesis